MDGDNLPANDVLNNAEYREKLYSIFSFYGNELQKILLNVKKNAGAAKEQLDTTKRWTYISLVAAITSLIAAVATVATFIFTVWSK